MWAYLGLVWSGGMVAPFFLVQVSSGVMPVSHKVLRVPQRCQTAWLAPGPRDPGGADGATFGVPPTLEVHFRLGTGSDLYLTLARGDHCVIDYIISVHHIVNIEVNFHVL